MDTNTAIKILTIESENLGVEIGTKSNLQSAIDLATQVLNGTLTTQLQELEDTKAQLAEFAPALSPETAKPAA